MFSIIFTKETNNEFFEFDTRDEASMKFEEMKKQVDKCTEEGIYASVIMTVTTLYAEEEIYYDNYDIV